MQRLFFAITYLVLVVVATAHAWQTGAALIAGVVLGIIGITHWED